MSEKEQYSIYELINKKDYQIEVQNEIKNLQGLQKNIYNFLRILEKDRELNFIELKKYKINELYKAILIGLNANIKYINENSKNNLELKYFLELLDYFGKQNNIGRLSNFEESKIDLLTTLYYYNNKNIKKIQLYAILDYGNNNIRKIFYKNLNSKLFKIIQFLIDDLVSELIVEEKKYKLSDLIYDTEKKVKYDTIKILQIPYHNYSEDFEEIFNILYENKDKDPIEEILIQNNLINKCEDLFDFVSLNKKEILKLENGETVYNFIIGIYEEYFTKTFNEHIKEQDVTYIDLVSITRNFLEIYEKINHKF